MKYWQQAREWWVSVSRGRGRRWAAYSAVFVSMFVLCVYLTFPYDRLRDRLLVMVTQSNTSRRPVQLQITTLSPWRLSGLEAEGVQVLRQSNDPSEAPFEVEIDKVRARLALLPLLIGRVTVKFEIHGAGGEVVGKVSDPQGEPALEADVTELHLQHLGFLSAAVGLPIRGTVNGHLEVKVPGSLQKLSGNAEIQIVDLQIGDGKTKLQLSGMSQGFTVETIAAGTLNLRMTAVEGNAQIEEFKVRGADISIDGKGNVRFYEPVRMSGVDLWLRILFTDRYRNRNERTRALFALMDFTPQLRDATTSEGALQYHLTGSLAGVNADPAGQQSM